MLLSQDGTATQSSGSGPAKRAVDGDTDQIWSGGSCMHTSANIGAKEAWWNVDLNTLYRIENITIWNRDEHNNRRIIECFDFCLHDYCIYQISRPNIYFLY